MGPKGVNGEKVGIQEQHLKLVLGENFNFVLIYRIPFSMLNCSRWKFSEDYVDAFLPMDRMLMQDHFLLIQIGSNHHEVIFYM